MSKKLTKQKLSQMNGQRIAHVAIVVRDYDEAIGFYTEKLKFTLVEDTDLGNGKRWVVVAPEGAKECSILLAKASTPSQESRIGNQTGGRVFMFLFTDDFDKFYSHLVKEAIEIIREPAIEEYGKVAVFADLYGNLWDLIQPTSKHSGLL